MKINGKVHEVIFKYGDKPFVECFKKMLEIPGVMEYLNKEIDEERQKRQLERMNKDNKDKK